MKSCMLENIGDTLDSIEKLPSPVARTCHVGNNTSNIWGMLSMIPNSYLLEYDHTLYSLDENCIPWVLLGSHGKIERCFDHYGREDAQWNGTHVNKHLRGLAKKYNILNYGIYADLEGQDLMSFHFNESSEMSKQFNNSSPCTDSMKVLENASLVNEIIRFFCETTSLDLVFNRWINISKKGITTTHPLTKINYGPGQVKMEIHGSGLVFSGTPDDLTAVLLKDLDLIVSRIKKGVKASVKGYPWFTLAFAYLFSTVQEAVKHPAQRVFWHGGGSSSQYYTNDLSFQNNFNVLWKQLAKGGFLPADGHVKLLPTFNCQLFSTTEEGAEILVQILNYWDVIMQNNSNELEKICCTLATSSDPGQVAETALMLLNTSSKKELTALVRCFNEKDANQLPVAHIANSKKENYNKFGASLNDLKNMPIKWPYKLRNYKWGEMELLLKVLGEIFADEME